MDLAIILAILKALEDQKKAAAIVKAKTASATTYLNQAETALTLASGYLDAVLNANSLTADVQLKNVMAKNQLIVATALLNQANADLALAQASLQGCPGDAAAQNAVAQAEAKRITIQQKLTEIQAKLAQAEDHKDLIAIPLIMISVKCWDYDSCSSNDPESNVDVTVSNINHPQVEPMMVTTGADGLAVVTGRFGKSLVQVMGIAHGEGDELQQTVFQTNTQSKFVSLTFDQ